MMPMQGSNAFPPEIVDAIIKGYDVRLTREVKDGIAYIKVVYTKYAGASRMAVGRAEDLKDAQNSKH